MTPDQINSIVTKAKAQLPNPNSIIADSYSIEIWEASTHSEGDLPDYIVHFNKISNKDGNRWKEQRIQVVEK